MDLWKTAEAIAAEASRDSGLDDRPNADPSVLAVAYLGLRLVPSKTLGPCLIEDRIYYPRGSSETLIAYAVAHEVGHFLARESRLRLSHADEEAVASRIGAALILPRRALLRDFRAGTRAVDDLVGLWPLSTARIMQRRLVELDA